MNRQLEKEDYMSIDYGANFAYNLNDNNLFQMTEYKILSSQKEDYLIRCMRVMMNGKVQLFYLTQDFRPLSMLISDLNGDQYCSIVMNIIDSIIDIKNNGFLSCCRIVTDIDRLYIDPNTLKVGLIYLPLSKRLYKDDIYLYNSLRSKLVRSAKEHTNLHSRRILSLCQVLSDGMIPFEEIHYKIPAEGLTGSFGTSHFSGKILRKMILKTIHSSSTFVFEIDKDEYVLGKGTSGVDGQIDFNKFVGRVHCKINRNNNHFYVTDLNSKNGTYIDGKRLIPYQATEIKTGNQLRLANVDFSVALN